MIQVLTQLCILFFLLLLLCHAKMNVSFANKCFCGVHCQSCVKFNFHSLKIRSYKSQISDISMVFTFEGDLTLYMWLWLWVLGLHGTSRSVRFPVGVSGSLAGAGWGLCCSCPHLTGSSLPLCLAVAIDPGSDGPGGWGRGHAFLWGSRLVQACFIYSGVWLLF